ncbi:MAG TPA: hypothetical protein VKR82_15890 [Candidatus Acidoferrales bacterium]|nr:hypothetical protein [Candidatus Acidoferrales bacterium]
MRNHNKTLATAIFVPILFGVINLTNVMTRPRFQEIRNLDVIQLLATGALFGVGLSAFVTWARSRNAQ